MADSTRSPNPIDIHVGRQIALYRHMAGMSQEALGDAIEVTFQQVQKYEKGTNRVGAGRLFSIGKALEVPISVFYDGLGGHEENATHASDALARDGLDLLTAFRSIQDAATRRQLIGLARLIAAAPGGGAADKPDA